MSVSFYPQISLKHRPYNDQVFLQVTNNPPIYGKPAINLIKFRVVCYVAELHVICILEVFSFFVPWTNCYNLWKKLSFCQDMNGFFVKHELQMKTEKMKESFFSYCGILWETRK